MNQVLLNNLIEQINSGRVVLFIGDALDDEMPPSARLTSALVDTCHAWCDFCRDAGQCQRPAQCVVPLTRAAQIYESQTNRNTLISFVRRQLATTTVGSVHRTIAKLPAGIIITTAFDDHLYAALQAEGHDVRHVVDDTEIPYGNSGQVQLIRLHGSISDAKSLVLTADQAQRLFQKLPIVSRVLLAYFASYTVLFIGYRLNDQHFEALYRQSLGPLEGHGRLSFAVQWPEDQHAPDYWHGKIHIFSRPPRDFLTLLSREVRPRESKRKQPPLPPEPYKFLDSFTAEDSAIFHGRQYEADRLLGLVLAQPLSILYGESGTGKTSLIQASVIPRVQEERYQVAYARPLSDAVQAVRAAIQSALWPGNLDPPLPLALNDLVARGLPAGGRLLIVLDQFEEFFIRQGQESRTQFIDELLQVLHLPERDIRCLFSLRSDYLDWLDELERHLGRDPLQHRMRLNNLGSDAAGTAILDPARAFGIKVELLLLDYLLNGLEQGGIAPDQLQVVCYVLWQDWLKRGKPERGLTLQHYQELGGTSAILANYLDDVIQGLGEDDTRRALGLALRSQPAQEAAQAVLKSMISAERTKVAVSWQEIAHNGSVKTLGIAAADIEILIEYLRNRRVIRRIPNAGRYELAHEVLIEKVWQWVSKEEQFTLEVQDVLARATSDARKFRLFLSVDRLNLIAEHVDQLALDEDALEVLLVSALANNTNPTPWVGRMRRGLSAAVLRQFLQTPKPPALPQDGHWKAIALATSTLAALDAVPDWDELIARLDDYTATHVRKTLRQLEEGRPAKDFVAERTSAEWREKSLWNTSSVVGIDFGTNSSAVAVMRNDRPIIVPNREGSRFTPSVVAFTEAGEVVVGTPALLQAATNPERTIFSIKRHLGTDWRVTIDGTTYTAVDIAALVFKQLKLEAEGYLGREVSEVVVGMPAYFDYKRRNELRKAAEQAGLEVVRIAAEPSLAAMGYGLDQGYDSTAAVYDLGGGTFDISILEIGDGICEVKAIDGDLALGGDDFDARIVDYLVQVFRNQHGIDLTADRTAMVRLKEAAERAKVTLSGLETVNIYVPYIYGDANGIKHLNVDLTRASFEELTKDLVEQTLQRCHNAIRAAGLQSGEIDELILVGLSTKMPLIHDSVAGLLGKQPRRGVDPDEAVAIGAAILAGVLDGKLKDTILLNVTSQSLGVETLGGVMAVIIEHNTTIPTRRSDIFSTVHDNQAVVDIHVFQGEHSMAKENMTLGWLRLEGIAPALRGTPQIEITFDIDSNDFLDVSIHYRATGHTVRRSISRSTRNQASVQETDQLLLEPPQDIQGIQLMELQSALAALENIPGDEQLQFWRLHNHPFLEQLLSEKPSGDPPV